jgi:AcrR family transcriptional regulator
MKTRITKEPEIRKNEIIDAASELFLTKGFDETSVSDIVNKVGVAQGLYYYYFKSKEEILDQVVERITEQYLNEFYRISNENTLNSIQKLQGIFQNMLFPQPQDLKYYYFIHEERNLKLHHRLSQKSLDGMIALLLNIIEQGVGEKLFDVEYPRETLEILMNGFEPYFHDIFRHTYTPEQIDLKIRAGLSILEKTLGASKGSLQIS